MRSTKGKRLAVGLAAVSLAVGAWGVNILTANALTGSTFEGADGNLVVNGAAPATDWASASVDKTIGVDLPTGGTDNSFRASKENEVNITVDSGSIPNSKADLGRFAEAHEVIQTAGAQHGHTMMYLAWTRNNTSGTTNFDFEINKAPQPDMTTPGPKVLVRTAGDLLVSYDFNGGAQRPELGMYTWSGTAWGNFVDLDAAGFAEGQVNRSVATGGPGPVNLGPIGAPAVNAPSFTFGEAAIDMTAAGVIPDTDDPNAPCAGFGSVYVKSRSSDPITATMKDFIAPEEIDLNNCGTIKIEKLTVPSGDTTEFDFNLSGGPSALDEDFSLLDTEIETFADIKAGSGYVATETPVDGYATTTDCDDTDSTVDNIVVAQGETVTCTFTNTLQIGAILVHKTAKHADSETGEIPQSGVVFNVTNAADADVDVDITTGTDGFGCADGFLVSSVAGDYTITEAVPTGYAAEDGVQDYTVVVGDCDSILDAAAAEFVNIPLTNVKITVDSQVDGGTSSVINCTGDPEDDVVTEANGDGFVETLNLQPTAPDTSITCTVVIDP